MAYTSESASDRLAAVRAAIDRCLTSQEYGTGDRRQRMAELKTLREMESGLMQELNESTNSGNMASLGRIQDIT